MMTLLLSAAADENMAGTHAVEQPASESSSIRITSDTMDMDLAANVGIFKGNVSVIDSGMTLTSDKLTLRFSEAQELVLAEATGNVVIVQKDMNRRAMADTAVYTVEDGKIVLTGHPQLTTGKDTLSNAAKITYYRDNERFVAEGAADSTRPTIHFTPKKETK